MKSINHRVRPMNLDMMCYDGRMIYTFLLTTIQALRNKDAPVNKDTEMHWSTSLALVMTIDEDEYNSPI